MSRSEAIDDLIDTIRSLGPCTTRELSEQTGRDPRLVREALRRSTAHVERVGIRYGRTVWGER